MYAVAKRQARGVSLLEILIYIFIFSMVVGGAIATAFWTYESSARTGRLGAAESEVDFVLRKINWASTGSIVTVPASGSTGGILTFTRDADTYTFTTSGSTLTLSVNGATAVPITTDHITVNSFLVEHIAASAGVPAAASTTLQINNKTYGPKIYYVR